jgi:hypothetical protein
MVQVTATVGQAASCVGACLCLVSDLSDRQTSCRCCFFCASWLPTQVTFPEKRVYSISSSVGSFAGTTGACLNRATSPTGASSVGLKLTVPCSAATSGSVVIKIASASATATSTANYNYQAFPMLVSPLLMCPTSKCPGECC